MNKLLISKKISNDQESIQSDPTSCPQTQKENEVSLREFSIVLLCLKVHRLSPTIFQHMFLLILAETHSKYSSLKYSVLSTT